MRYKRSSTLTVYWQEDTLYIHHYARQHTVSASLVTLEILNGFSDWLSLDDAITKFSHFAPESVQTAIAQLLQFGLLVQETTEAAENDAHMMETWGKWLPEASIHFATKDSAYPVGMTQQDRLNAILAGGPQPAPFKTLPDAPQIALPPVARPDTEFNRVLLNRRTHRKFSGEPVTLDEVNQLLSLVWGVTGYVDAGVFGLQPLKTSPSGGARHPGEVYVMALNVSGLERGIYHYNCRDHVLERVNEKATPSMAARFCVGQEHASEASVLFLMTAVFRRSMWKYHMPRAYRVLTLETGHLGQTFCLTATAMGLAPFTTAALKDTLVERELNIDGINESILYVAGVGRPVAASARSTKIINNLMER